LAKNELEEKITRVRSLIAAKADEEDKGKSMDVLVKELEELLAQR